MGGNLIEKLAKILKDSKLGSVKIGSDSVIMDMAHIVFRDNTVTINYDIECSPSLGSKITLLVYLYARGAEKDFQFGEVYTSTFNAIGLPDGIVYGQAAFDAHEKNLEFFHEHKLYYDRLLEKVDPEALHSC